MKTLFDLWLSFFKIGLFTFGGGYAMLPLMERETVTNHHWVTEEEILDIFSMSQCTPGVIAVNTATFIGRKIAGFPGAVFATLAVVTPSVIIITLIASLLTNFADFEIVENAFSGIRAAVAALIFASVIKIFKSSVKSKLQLLVCAASFVLVAFFGTSPLVIVIGSALFGFFFIPLAEEVPSDA